MHDISNSELYGFDRYGKVKCWKIEQMLPKLMKMVEGEMRIL